MLWIIYELPVFGNGSESCWPQLLSSEARLGQRHHIASESSYNKCPGGTWSSWEQTGAANGCRARLQLQLPHVFFMNFPMRPGIFFCLKSYSNIVSWKKGLSTDKSSFFQILGYRKKLVRQNRIHHPSFLPCSISSHKPSIDMAGFSFSTYEQ